jgi:hypothetical protein
MAMVIVLEGMMQVNKILIVDTQKWQSLYKLYAKSFEYPCHTLNRSNCYILGDTYLKDLQALEFSLNNEHLFCFPTYCATSVFGKPAYTDIKLSEVYEAQSPCGQFVYFKYDPRDEFKVGLYSIAATNYKSVSIVYDFDGCSTTSRQFNPIPSIFDSCYEKTLTDPKSFKMYLEESTPVYIGLNSSKIRFSLFSEELEHLTEKQGTIHTSPSLNYKAFSYQNEKGAIGHLLLKAKAPESKASKTLFLYYDSESCNKNYSKLPRENKNCKAASGGPKKHEAILRIPTQSSEMHYIAVEQIYYDKTDENHITLEYQLQPAEVLVINTSKLYSFDQTYVTSFILKNNGSEEIVIKVMNTSPKGTCRIYADYEGCNKQKLNKLPDQDNYCLDSGVPKEGHICMLKFNTKEKKDTIYFSVRAMITTARMNLIVNGISK